jgi:hypothetical protein
MYLPTRKSSAIKSARNRGLILAAGMVAIGALASTSAVAQEQRTWEGTPTHEGYTDHHWGYGGYYNGYVGSYGSYNDTPAWSYSYPVDQGSSYNYYNYGSPGGYYPYGYTTYYPYGYSGYYPYGYAPAPGFGVQVGPVGIGVYP